MRLWSRSVVTANLSLSINLSDVMPRFMRGIQQSRGGSQDVSVVTGSSAYADDDNRESLINAPDQLLDLVGVRPKLLGKLVEVRTGYFLKAGLVDVGDDLHPHPLSFPAACCSSSKPLVGSLLVTSRAAARTHCF